MFANNAVGTWTIHQQESLVTAQVTPESGPAAAEPAEFSALTKAVANASGPSGRPATPKSCRSFPRCCLLLQAACDSLDGDARLRACALSADAYHVAASVLLKLDDHGLAWLAADRSMRAAAFSQAAARRWLQRPDHHPRPDGRWPFRCRDHDCEYPCSAPRKPTCAARPRNPCRCTGRCCYVVPSPLRREKTATAPMTLLNEAGQAGSASAAITTTGGPRSGPPTSCFTESTSSVRLGDAGSANQLRPQSEPGSADSDRAKGIVLRGHRASVSQGANTRRPIHALRAAEELAPQEVRCRPAVRRLVSDLLATAPPTIRPHLSEFAARIGTPR